MADRGTVLGMLDEWGATTIPHPGGTLFDHLVRTEAILTSWRASHELALAGLCHAAYGTDGFAPALLSLEERPVLVELIGRGAEALVYRYASCDRGYLSRQLGGQGEVRFRDRFEPTTIELSPASLTGFMELTFANELDVVRHNAAFAAREGPRLAEVFRRCRGLVTASAYAAFEGLFESTSS